MIGSHALLSDYKSLYKEIHRVSLFHVEKNTIQQAIQILSSQTVASNDIISKHNIFVEPLLPLLQYTPKTTEIALNIIQSLSIQELLPIPLCEPLFKTLQNVRSSDNTNIRIVQIISSLLTNSSLPTLPPNLILSGLHCLVHASTTTILKATIQTVLLHITTTTTSLFTNSITKSIPTISYNEAIQLIHMNKNFNNEPFEQSTEPIVISLSTFLKEILISQQYNNSNTDQSKLLTILCPILSNGFKLFYCVKPFYKLLLQNIIPNLLPLTQHTVDYHSLLLNHYSNYPGYPTFFTKALKQSPNISLDFIYHYLTSCSPSFILSTHFNLVLIQILTMIKSIAHPVEMINISSPKTNIEFAFYSYYLIISHILSSPHKATQEVVDECINIILTIGRIQRNESISILLELLSRIDDSWNVVKNIVQYIGKDFNDEWKVIWRMIGDKHKKSLGKITRNLSDSTLTTMIQNFIEISNTFEHYEEIMLILHENFYRLDIVMKLINVQLLHIVLIDTSIANLVLTKITDIFSLLSSNINKDTHHFIHILIEFIVNIITNPQCPDDYYLLLLQSLTPLLNGSIDLIPYCDLFNNLFTPFTKSSSQIVLISFNTIKQIIALLPPQNVPIQLLQKYIEQTKDINISLSSIQLLSDVVLLLKNIDNSNELILHILQQLYNCINDKRYDVWSSVLQTLIQLLSCINDSLLSSINELHNKIVFPLFHIMNDVYIRILNEDLPTTSSNILHSLNLPLRQWNDTICTLISGITRILQYFIPQITKEYKKQTINEYLSLVKISLYKPTMLTCEIVLKYIFTLIKLTLNDQDISQQIISMYLFIAQYIINNNGVTSTVSSLFLNSIQHIIKTKLIKEVVDIGINFVKVFPDDFGVENNGLTTSQLDTINLIQIIMEQYSNTHEYCIDMYCKMIDHLTIKYDQKRMELSSQICLKVVFEKIHEIINKCTLSDMNITNIAHSISKSQKRMIDISQHSIEEYKTISDIIYSLHYIIGKYDNNQYYNLCSQLFNTSKEVCDLNPIIFEKYEVGIHNIGSIIKEGKQVKYAKHLIDFLQSKIYFNEYSQNVSIVCVHELISISLITNDIGKYTCDLFLSKVIEELNECYNHLDEYNVESYQIKECIFLIQSLVEFIDSPNLESNKMQLYSLSLLYIQTNNSTIRSAIILLLNRMKQYIKFI
ncbi:Uncharacterized protein QTN25_000568 [Entamoeba marina]